MESPEKKAAEVKQEVQETPKPQPEPPKKKPYSSPVMSIYGDLRETTKMIVGGAVNADNNPNRKTS